MIIFIDASGVFVPVPQRNHRVSCIAALVVPHSSRKALFTDTELLRKKLVGTSELKGSRLDEGGMAEVLSLLRRYGVIVRHIVIDMAARGHGITELEAFRRAQAEKLVEHLSPQHTAVVVKAVNALRARALEMPLQLFVEFWLLVELVPDLLQTVTLYYSQRMPDELGEFEWIIDAKDRTLTEAEEFWRDMVLPFLENTFVREPLKTLEGTALDRFVVTAESSDDTEKRHLRWLEARPDRKQQGDADFLDMERILGDRLSFQNSSGSLGLQLADVAASALSRALNGTLKRQGWRDLGSLTVRGLGGKAIRAVALSADPLQPRRPWEGVLADRALDIESTSQPLLLNSA